MIEKIKPQKLDSTTDPLLVKGDSMTDALNVVLSEGDFFSDDGSGDFGVMKSSMGNKAVQGVNDFDLPDQQYDYKILGSVLDKRTNVVYFFVWSSNQNHHGIYAYDKDGVLPTDPNNANGVKDRVRLILRSNTLKFKKSSFVSADVVHSGRSTFEKYGFDQDLQDSTYWDLIDSDAIIYFTDNVNEPKKVNAYRALLENSQQTGDTATLGYSDYNNLDDMLDFISACPRTPLKTIEFEFLSDDSVQESNFINADGFQFAYQLVYKDGIESSISPYSEIAVPKVRLEQGTNTSVNYYENNLCKLYIPAEEYNRKEVEAVKIIAREGDLGDFLLIDKITKADPNSLFDEQEFSYRFYNNKVLSGVSTEEVNKQFDSVPQAAEAQVVSNNRLFYGNYVEGFDNVSITAKIIPQYKSLSDAGIFDLSIKPAIRSHRGLNTAPNKKNYNVGASFIIDASEITELNQGDNVSISLSISPDRNFHLFKNVGLKTTKDSEDIYGGNYAEDFLDVYTDINEQNSSYIFSGTHSWMNPTGAINSLPVFAGKDVSHPVIFRGGTLNFSFEFTYNGELVYNEEASSRVAETIYSMMCGLEPPSYINVLSNLNLFTHEIDLELQHFQTIVSGRPNAGVDGDGGPLPNPPSNQDPLSYLIFPFSTSKIPAWDPKTEKIQDAPYGPSAYGIVDKASLVFGFQKVEQEGGKAQVLLTVKEIANLEVVNCIRRPNMGSYQWTVINEDISQNLLTAFLSQTGFNSLHDYYQIGASDYAQEDFSLVTTPIGGVLLANLFNYKRQFGNTKIQTINIQGYNPIEYDSNINNNNIGDVLVDGESGIGGYNGISGHTNKEITNCGSISIFSGLLFSEDAYLTDTGLNIPNDQAWGQLNPNVNFGLVNGVRFVVGGLFFCGSHAMRLYSVNSFWQYPLLKSVLGDKSVPLASPPLMYGANLNNTLGDNQSVSGNYPFQNLYDENLIHAQIELVSQPVISLSQDQETYDYKSFKTNSFHELGVVYYDKRGRHGFVNPIGAVYINGYSDQERPNGGKGKVNLSVSIASQAPEWASKFKLVHSTAVSIDDFIQYSCGGAYVQLTGSDTEKNIYISLNYLQQSVASYSSSFGARSPEGDLNLYKFTKGDRVRIISYETQESQTVYPHKYEFEVVDAVLLGVNDNPLHDGTDDAPYYKTGQFLVLKNNLSANGFTHQDVDQDNTNWGKNCIMEIYTPSKISSKKIYYEIGDLYSINSQGNHESPVVISDGDVWWRRVAVNKRDDINEDILVLTPDGQTNPSKSNFKNVYLETKTSTDLIKSNSIGLGRPNTEYKDAKRKRNEASITYSQPTAQTSNTIRYSDFNVSLLNYKDINKDYGFIKAMIDRGDSIFVIQDDKCSMIPVGKNVLNDAANAEFLTSSTEVLGPEKFYSGDAGASNHPESVCAVGNYVYFVHKPSNSVFCWNENSGIENISDIGISSEIKQVLNQEVSEDEFLKIVSGYDPFNDEFVLTIKKHAK
jgi:hypothetical protein